MQYDSRMPSYVQRSFDYLGARRRVPLWLHRLTRSAAPEYNPDSPVSTASDMWTLGCLIYAVHNKGLPPFRNHGSLTTLRDNANKPLTGMDGWDPDLRSEYR